MSASQRLLAAIKYSTLPRMSIITQTTGILKAFLREPLVHFMALGSVLFFIAHDTNSSLQKNTQTITITASQIEQINTRMQSLLKHPLTQTQLQQAIDDYVTEEVLLREGFKLGVVEEDPIIRTRVAERVKFLLSDTTLVSEPTDAMLATFLQNNINLFSQSSRRSFIHIYFDPAKHGDQLMQAIENTKQKIAKQKTLNPLEWGDTFSDGNEYQQMDKSTLANTFGEAFANAVFTVPLNVWQGPIQSNRGLHLLFVSEELAPQQPTLNNIRQQVKQAYMDDQHRQQNLAAINQLKQQYKINIEPFTLPATP